jgi:hypothetical protein
VESILPDGPDNNVTPIKATRKPVSRRARFEVLKRDNYTCRYCRSTDNVLTIDHVIPVSLGGTDEPGNLVACCKDCNSGKSSSTPDDSSIARVLDDALRWSAAMQVAAGLALDDLEADQQYAAAFDRTWCGWTVQGTGELVDRPIDWRISVTTWRAAGMPLELLIDGASRALSNTRIPIHDKWRYFCGITWNRLTELQDRARLILDTEVSD